MEVGLPRTEHVVELRTEGIVESRQGHHRCLDYNENQRDHQVRCASTRKCLDSLQPQLCAHMGIVNKNDLMVGGTEPNLGPDDKILYKGWSRDASWFLWPTIGVTESSLSARVKRLLKYFDPCTKGGSLIFTSVNAILSKTDDALCQQFFPGREGDVTREMRWECVKRNLDALLPAIFALDAEAELKSMKKDPKGSLLQFFCHFQATMQWYDETQLNAQRAAHILLRKLPQVLQRRLATKRFDVLSVDFIYQKA